MRDEDITTSKLRETINRALIDRMHGLFDKFKQAGETDAAEEVYKTDVISLFKQVIESRYQILQKRKEKSNNDDLSQSFDDRARPNKASLYAVTWCALDHCNGKLDISPATFSRGAYRLRDPAPLLPVKNDGLTTPREVADTG